ncbi:MAG: LysR family transcriptional regulator, partial [Clostridiales bacterium]|nr:LysR family transcriptional regulator [Clostridiales bacterium]
VSQAIAGLEQKTGCRLFTRKSRKVLLTAEGDLLFKHVEQAFNFIKSAEGKLSEMHNLGLGEIRIGIGDTNCRYFLTPYIEQFITAYPKIKFKVVNRTTPQILDILKNGQIDIGIVTLPSVEAAEMNAMDISPFRKVRDVFVASAKHSELKGRKVSLSELASHPLLLLQKDSSTRVNLDSFFKNSGLEVIPEIELESMELLVEFARIGLGAAHVLYESAEALITSGELFVIDLEEAIPERSLGLAKMKNVPLSRAASEFLYLLNPQAQQ